jgi:hypothetical protein
MTAVKYGGIQLLLELLIEWNRSLHTLQDNVTDRKPVFRV